ncbi:hypothetical protein WICPIJ_007607 [Wickerhamomyces pijperi]|uniref:HMA domain-containing protein n=1 Tax=Wickerhamomyces pijperi TaxID=599730 RepID=A0A9P8Q1H1_WICPI|nr:hypothetical protein WICPIJ_007607 [Wickerhamomyces pijperi]
MQTLWVEVSNIHCEDCKQTIQSSLQETIHSEFPDFQFLIKIINNSEVSIISSGGDSSKKFPQKLVSLILAEIEDLGFIVKDYKLYVIDEESNENTELSLPLWVAFKKYWFMKHMDVSENSHFHSCSKCREEHEHGSKSEEAAELTYKVVLEIRDTGYNQAKVKGIIKPYTVPKSEIQISEEEVIFKVHNKQYVNLAISMIKSNLSLTQVELVEMIQLSSTEPEEPDLYKVEAIISGMTCAACASSITTAIKDLPFLSDFSISVVSKTGEFIVNSKARDKLDALVESIEDCGFDIEIMDVNRMNSRLKKRVVNLKISGMFCDHCPENISEFLNKIGQVENDLDFSVSNPVAKFSYVPSKELKLRNILQDLHDQLGFHVEISKKLDIDEQLRLISKRETFKIVYRLALTTIIVIPTFVFGIVGMSLVPKSNQFRIWLDEAAWAGNVSRATWILFILSSPVYFFATDIFHRKALKEITSLWSNSNVSMFKRFCKFGSMNLLMSLGTTISYFASIILLIMAALTKRKHASMAEMGFTTTYFDSVVFLTFFLLIGRLLESYSKTKTAESISNLGELKPKFATLLTDEQVNLNLLELDDLIKIKPGESPPLDCLIVEGESSFDESALTGESKPILRTKGEQIFTGTINKGPNLIKGKIMALDGDSLIDQIIKTVRDGQMKRAPVERIADIVTGYFVPVIVLLAILTWIIWLSLGLSGRLPASYLDIDLGGWYIWSLEFAIAVFVIACPCGIGLAAPTAIFVGIGIAAKNGILARGGGVAFQECGDGKIDTICFDKTGTLTNGELKVTNYAVDSLNKALALKITKELESSSTHPIAVSVKTFIEELETLSDGSLDFSEFDRSLTVSQIQEISGKGLKCDIFHNNSLGQVILGNELLMKEHQVQISSKQEKLINNWKLQGKSIVVVSSNHPTFSPHQISSSQFKTILILACRDEIRPESKSVINLLKQRQIQTWMVTGDNELTAMTIAKELGIDNVLAQVLPEEKAEKVKWLQSLTNTKNSQLRSKVCMVGDGINDSIALSTADIGISLSSGSELAITSSDFVLLNNRYPLLSILTLFELSSRVFQRIKFNFGWAIVYNLIGIPIAAGVIYPIHNSRLSPVWASAAMALSSISVVLSSLSLKFFRKRNVADLLEDRDSSSNAKSFGGATEEQL